MRSATAKTGQLPEQAKPLYNGNPPFFLPIITSWLEGIALMTDQTMHIVVGVDDDIRIREAIESLVESAGFTSLVFPSAEEFLRSGKVTEVSCLITDVRMPGMDGIELHRRVRF